MDCGLIWDLNSTIMTLAWGLGDHPIIKKFVSKETIFWRGKKHPTWMYDTIDNKIDKNYNWLQLGIDSYKVKCKDLLLKWMAKNEKLCAILIKI